jgi:hypothetical protein
MNTIAVFLIVVGSGLGYYFYMVLFERLMHLLNTDERN